MLAAIAGPVKAALTDQILIRKGRIWIERLKIDHEAIFRVSAPRIFNAAADLAVAIASVAGEVDSEATGLVAAAALAVVIASAAAAIVLAAVAADLADSAAEGSEADVDNDS